MAADATSIVLALAEESQAKDSIAMTTLSKTDGPVSYVDPGGVTDQKDYFVERDGLRYAGTHLLIDLWGAKHLDSVETIETALRESAAASGATLLNIDLHRFSTNGGISGIAVLAESHISIHTWPERNYAAIDIFMCGGCDPYAAIPVLRRILSPDRVQLTEQKRGLLP